MCVYLRAWVCLWYSVGCGVHELGEVHHALSLVLGDVDALDGGEAGVGVPEVLELQLPLGQPGACQLHKHLTHTGTLHTHTHTLDNGMNAS